MIRKKEKYKVTFPDGTFILVEAISNWDAKEQGKRLTGKNPVQAYPADDSQKTALNSNIKKVIWGKGGK